VIAQRTANVSKTVLTQCNTIIAFQELDRTSSEFLSNYFGDAYTKALPNLKFRQAIATGKALRSTVPMIFEVPTMKEQSATTQTEQTSTPEAVLEPPSHSDEVITSLSPNSVPPDIDIASSTT
jgi:hypothetical protein